VSTNGKGNGGDSGGGAGGTTPNIWTFLIVLVGILAVLAGAWWLVQHYTNSDKALAAMGLVTTAVATITAAAFGVSTGASAGAAAGNASAKAANESKRNKQQQALNLADHVQQMRGQRWAPVRDQMLGATNFDNGHVGEVESSLATIEAQLRAIADSP
jgi:hypothetical protein